MGMLGAVFAFAVRRGLRPDNPVHGVARHAYEQRQTASIGNRICRARRGVADHARDGLADCCSRDEVSRPDGLAARRNARLKWSEVDLATRTARLEDTKTGASLRPLSHAACDVLRELPRLGALVFPASVGADKPMRGFHKVWLRVAKQAALGADVTPHVLRHTFASVADDLGYSELTIAALIGHKKASVTSRYAHRPTPCCCKPRTPYRDRIAELMGDTRSPGVVIELPPRRGAK